MGKWFLQRKASFLFKTNLAQAAQLPWTSGSFKEQSDFEEKFCPRQRSCPGQVVSSKKEQISEEQFCPRQRSCPGQVASSKKADF